ncbi:MAG: AAA family ATPase [Polyangiales bacterium]
MENDESPTALSSSQPPARPAVPPAIQRWFAALTLLDSRAQLVEAGGTPGTEILLSDVFVDLPLETVVSDTPEDTAERALDVIAPARRHSKRASRQLVFGGPGEGKSSLTAVAAMLLRRQWLADTSALDTSTAARLDRVHRSLEQLRPEALDQAPVVPLRVDLPKYVAFCNDDGSGSFWSWVTQQFAQLADAHDEADTLERALRELGSLCWILDGLDEIAPGPAREKLIETIRAMGESLDHIVITTRPQGFEEHLDAFDSFVIAPLRWRHAEQIAQRLTTAWSASGLRDLPEFERVNVALQREDIRNVATTALHVTLITVVALTRELPTNRAALFELFFQTLFRRELAKKVEPDIREDDEDVLLALHGRLGLALHALSQQSRGFVWLSEADCATHLGEILAERGYDDDYTRRRASTLLRFSRDRLVLLRRLHSDGFAFGIRSFQEYFAARALIEGELGAVVARLAATALDPYWSNVVELAACELLRAKSKHERDRAASALTRTAAHLASIDTPSEQRAALGPSFALWMLEATASITAPWAQNPLFDVALDICASASRPSAIGRSFLQLGPPRVLPERLSVYSARSNDERHKRYQALLLERVTDRPASLDVWAILAPMLAANVEGASEIASNFEPASSDELESVVRFLVARFDPQLSTWVQALLVRRWPEIRPRFVFDGDAFVVLSSDPSAIGSSVHRRARFFVSIDAETDNDRLVQFNGSNRLLFERRARSAASATRLTEATQPLQWSAAFALQRFNDAPSPSTLVGALRAIANGGDTLVRALLLHNSLPWPVAACLAWAGNDSALEALIERIEHGALGDVDDWAEIEANSQSRDAWIPVTQLIDADPSERGPWLLPSEGASFPTVFTHTYLRDDGPFGRVRAERCTPYTWRLAEIGIIAPFAEPVRAAFLAEHPWLVPLSEEELAAFEQSPRDGRPQRSIVDAPELAHFRNQIPLDATWRRLALPGPSPERAVQQQAPVHITSLDSLSGLRAFATTPTILGSLPPVQPREGQWLVLLGENGSGKTTLLRSIAIALIEQETATKLLTNQLRLLRNGEDGHVRLTANNTPYEVRVRRTSEGEEVVEALSPPPIHRPWVVAYGVRRSTALGEPGRSAELRGTANLHSLFELPGALVYAPTWLNEQYKLVLTERDKNRKEKLEPEYHGPDERVWLAIEKAFDKLLRIQEIDASGRELFVVHRDFGRIRFDQLSDGYLTTAGWIIDLVARWIAHNARVALPEDVLGHMTGFVLIDEIDLHLHPLWQMRIIDEVRKLFPKLSFIVTTHNPLTVHGARPGEVFVLRREPANETSKTATVVIEQRDIRPGSDIDRVLFDLFGVKDTLDSTTRALLDKHLQLLRSGAQRDDPKRLELEERIRALLGAGGSALLDQRGARVAPVGALSEEARRAALDWFGEGD